MKQIICCMMVLIMLCMAGCTDKKKDIEETTILPESNLEKIGASEVETTETGDVPTEFLNPSKDTTPIETTETNGENTEQRMEEKEETPDLNVTEPTEVNNETTIPPAKSENKQNSGDTPGGSNDETEIL